MSNEHGCPKCGERGVAIGSIAGKETMHGEYSFGGGGFGAGTFGIGMFAVGGGGTSKHETERARQMRRPKLTQFRMLAVFGPLLILFLMWYVTSFTAGFSNAMLRSTAPATAEETVADRMETTVSNVTNMLPLLVGGLAVAAGLIFMVTIVPRRWNEESDRHAAETRRDTQRQAIYDRLRFCETDNLVFDPQAPGFCVPAEKERIRGLIEQRIPKQHAV